MASPNILVVIGIPLWLVCRFNLTKMNTPKAVEKEKYSSREREKLMNYAIQLVGEKRMTPKYAGYLIIHKKWDRLTGIESQGSSFIEQIKRWRI